MSKFLWGISGLLYLVFVVWYTDFGGPLSGEEIAEAVTTMEEAQFPPDRIELFANFMRTDEGHQFIMLNLLALAALPAGDESAEQLMGRYMEHMYPQLLMRASHPVFFGQVVSSALDISGVENAAVWDQGALMRYKSRRAFMEIVLHPETRARHLFKLAALEKTIAVPVEVSLTTGDPRLVLALFLLAVTALVDLVFIAPAAARN